MRSHRALLALSLLLAACASMTPIEAPRVAVEGLRIDRMTGAGAQFTALVGLANPNDREIVVDAIDAEVRIEDIAVGTVRLAAPVRLPARGSATTLLSASAEWSAALKAASRIVLRADAERGDAPMLRYAVSGIATLEGGRTIPFSRAGEFAWARGGVSRK
jgi:LEA14-like dessication related protein